MLFRRIILIGCTGILLFPSDASAFFPRSRVRTSPVIGIHAIALRAENIRPGATHVPLLRLRFDAPCGQTAHIESIRVQLIGRGNAHDIDGVYIEQARVRLSRRMAFSSSDRTVILRPRRLEISPCTTAIIDISADISLNASIGGEFALRIVSPEDIRIRTDHAALRGDFPLTTNGTMNIEVVPTGAGNIEATFLQAPRYIPIANNALAKFYLEATTGPYQCIERITLTNDGSAKNDEMRDMYIARTDGIRLTNIVPTLDRDRAVLEFMEPYCLEEKKKQLFTLWGKAYTRRKLNDFVLEEPSDVYAIPIDRLPR